MYRALRSPGFMKGFHLFLHHKTGNIVEQLVLRCTEKCVGPKKAQRLPFTTPQKSRADHQVNSTSLLVSHPSSPRLRFLCKWPVPHRVVVSRVQGREEHGPGVQLPLRKGKRNRGGEATRGGGLMVTPCPFKGMGKWLGGKLGWAQQE